MPGIVAHHVFGRDVYGKLSPLIGGEKAHREAFLLGNLGPDPFFYLRATPLPPEVKRIGVTMHREKTVGLLDALHERMVALGGHEGVKRAYALGFLCHYLLDSTVHPLVYAQEFAICSKPLGELPDKWAHRVVHATIETVIDERLLTTRLGTTAAQTPPHETMLKCPLGALNDISRGYGQVLSRVYDAKVPPTAFVTAISLNRAGQVALDTRSAGVRRVIDILKSNSAATAYVDALSIRPDRLLATKFGNDDHVPWPDPYCAGRVIDSSFDELFARALDRALDVLPVYAQPALGPGWCEGFVGDINFLGRREGAVPVSLVTK